MELMAGVLIQVRASQWQTDLAIACAAQDGESVQKLSDEFARQAGGQKEERPTGEPCQTPLTHEDFLRQLDRHA